MRTVSTTIGGKWLGLAMAAFCFWTSIGTAQAGPLWYNGDFDGNNEAYNAVAPSGQAYVYDDFNVPAGQTWSLTDVFSNNLLFTSAPVTSAYYEIREGIPNGGGDGGLLLASGTGLATVTATGRTDPILGYSEYTVDVPVTGITLTGGATGTTYWLDVSPVVGLDSDFSYLTTTSGANAIGMPQGNDGNSYLDGSLYNNGGSTPFQPAGNLVSPLNTTPENNGQPDFSMGVNGVIISSVPEPSTLVMGVIGTLSLLGHAWRSRRLRA